MNGRRTTPRVASITLLSLFCVFALACGGGGGGSRDGGGMTPVGLTASFVADNPSPGANTVSLAAGAASGTDFNVEVRVTGITAFYGAGFRLTYDPTSARFDSFDTTGSIVSDIGVLTDFRVDSSTAGVIIVGATRQGLIAGVDTSMSGDLLISFNFEALVATSGNAFAFEAQEAQSCPTATGACTTLGPTDLSWDGGMLVAN